RAAELSDRFEFTNFNLPPPRGDQQIGGGHISEDRRFSHQSASTHMATPMPPPMHRVARPFFAPRRCISNTSVLKTRAPEAPIGCPMAMAPPLTLTMSGFQPMSLLTAQACAANASLASTRSRSPAFQPARSSALREAGI